MTSIDCKASIISFALLLLSPQSSSTACKSDADCPENLICYSRNCSDLCSPFQCAENADCRIRSHRIVCDCREGFNGDGIVECIDYLIDGATAPDIYCHWNDILKENCREISAFYVIDAVINSIDYTIDPKYMSNAVESFEISAESEDRNFNANLLPKVAEIFQNLVKYKATRQSVELVGSNDLQNLRLVQQLELQENLIEGIEPNAFRDLIQLRYVDLSNNKIGSLDESLLLRNPKIEFIDLSGNRIASLAPKFLENQMNLLHFWAKSNRISKIDDGFFENCSKIEKISFAVNNLTEIGEATFEGLHELTHLYLQFNKIQTLGENFLKNCRKLEKIWLNSNRVAKISSKAFENLPELGKVELSGNKIESLDENFLKNSLKISRIHLSHNNIKEFSAKIIKGKDNLVFLGLNENACIDSYFGFQTSFDPMTNPEKDEAIEELQLHCN